MEISRLFGEIFNPLRLTEDRNLSWCLSEAEFCLLLFRINSVGFWDKDLAIFFSSSLEQPVLSPRLK